MECAIVILEALGYSRQCPSTILALYYELNTKNAKFIQD